MAMDANVDKARLRLECFNAVQGYGHFEGEGNKRTFISDNLDARIKTADRLFNYCMTGTDTVLDS